MILLEQFTGQMTDAEVAMADNFIRAVNIRKGENTRRTVFSGDIFKSRIRAKMAEVFISELFNTPLDLSVHGGDDRGIDTIYEGQWVQIKRAGTRTVKRGKPYFKMELNDRYIENPPWDLGFVVEDDADDERVFRFAGWVTRGKWLTEKIVLDWPPTACWAVTRIYPPIDLLRFRPNTPTRSWPPPPRILSI